MPVTCVAAVKAHSCIVNCSCKEPQLSIPPGIAILRFGQQHQHRQAEPLHRLVSLMARHLVAPSRLKISTRSIAASQFLVCRNRIAMGPAKWGEAGWRLCIVPAKTPEVLPERKSA